jgi:hypothetical protein
MAYMSQERKAQLAPAVKAILKKYGVKGSLSVDNHSGLTLTLKSGKIDFGSAEERFNNQVNVYHIGNYFNGVAQKFLEEVKAAMSVGNWNKSEIQYDYFDVGWYVYINIGKWNKPYVLEK